MAAKYTKATDISVTFSFCNMTIKVVNLPHAFKYYHSYVYFQHTNQTVTEAE